MVNDERLEKLNDFLYLCNVSPVKKIEEPLKMSSERTCRRYSKKAQQCISLLCETICPGEGNFLEELVSGVQNVATNGLLNIVGDAYLQAETRIVRRQLLSLIVTDYSFNQISEVIPGLTQYNYYIAKKHAGDTGQGAPVPHIKHVREKVDVGVLESFIDFITSSHVIKDLPFGHKTLKLTSGEIISTPNAIRSLAPATIIQQYSQYCVDENIQSLGE